MKKLKFLGVLTAAILAILCAVLVVVWLTINPNNYKGKIAARVKESTGRELTLTGDIKLSVFPWVALELGPATLGNPAGFSDEPFLSFSHASVRVKLLPLLHQRLEVARVAIDRLDLRLAKNAQGRGNWQGAESPARPAKPSDGDAARYWEGLANVRVKKGRVSYEGITLSNIDFETGSVGADHQIPVNLSLDGNRGIPGEQASLHAKFHVSEDATGEQLRFAAVNLTGTVTRAGEAVPAPWDVSAPDIIKINLTEQTLALPAFTMNYANARVSGAVSATKILDDLHMAGTVTLAPLVLREFAARLGFALPRTRDQKVLSQLSASTEFAYDAKALALNKLEMRLDDTQLQGNLSLPTGKEGAIEFDLAADQIDLDRYRAPEGAAEPSPSEKAAKSGNPLDANGTFKLKTARVMRVDFSNLHITLAAKNNVIHLFPIEAQVDGAHYAGNITIDGRGPVPVVSVDEHLTGVDMTRLLANTAQKGRLSGRATLNIKATARGATVDACLKTLTGHLEANLADGALEGIDVAYEFGVAQALIDRSAAPPRNNTGHTKFEAFKTTAQITNGVAETHDLTIASQVLKVTGQGSANLSSKAIDFKLLAAILTAPARSTEIPLKVTGTYVDPTVRPDVEAVAKDQLKQKLQDVLKKNGLGGLFKR
jgi:AsmA protein